MSFPSWRNMQKRNRTRAHVGEIRRMSDEQDPPALGLRPRKKPADDEAAADSKDAQTEKPKLSLKPKTDSASSEAPSLSLKPKTAEPAKESPPNARTRCGTRPTAG
jgi:hypothetical protein